MCILLLKNPGIAGYFDTGNGIKISHFVCTKSMFCSAPEQNILLVQTKTLISLHCIQKAIIVAFLKRFLLFLIAKAEKYYMLLIVV